MNLIEFKKKLASDMHCHRVHATALKTLADLYERSGSTSALAASLLDTFGTRQDALNYCHDLEMVMRYILQNLKLTVALECRESETTGGQP